jgi:hypothetical protein
VRSQPGLLPVRRQLRITAILSAAQDAGLSPLPVAELHAVAYFADALAPVWDLRILEEQLLKRKTGPSSPTLQHDVDRLVGRGVVIACSLRHRADRSGRWRLEASYVLHSAHASRILASAKSFPEYAAELEFVSEVVHAMSGLGLLGIAKATNSDAAYGNRLVDTGNLVDIGASENLTAQVALRFGDLLEPQVDLTAAEMVHLYVHQLYKRLQHAA